MLNVYFSCKIAEFVLKEMDKGTSKQDAINIYRNKLHEDFWRIKYAIEESEDAMEKAYHTAELQMLDSKLDVVEYIEKEDINVFNFLQEASQEVELLTQEAHI